MNDPAVQELMTKYDEAINAYPRSSRVLRECKDGLSRHLKDIAAGTWDGLYFPWPENVTNPRLKEFMEAHGGTESTGLYISMAIKNSIRDEQNHGNDTRMLEELLDLHNEVLKRIETDYKPIDNQVMKGRISQIIGERNNFRNLLRNTRKNRKNRRNSRKNNRRNSRKNNRKSRNNRKN